MWNCLSHLKASTRARNSINDFVRMIKGASNKAGSLNAFELANHIAKQSGLADLLRSDTSIEGMGRLENFNSLLDGIKSFVEEDTIIDTETIPDKTLATFLQSIALLTDNDDDEQKDDFVTLMSVHSAKGLEFKSIFIVGLEEKLFPSFLSMDSQEAIDEERRLFYVAITRAEQFLTLTYANSRYRYGKTLYNDPSRFLEEIPGKHMESTSSIRSRSQGTYSSNERSGAKVVGNFKQKPRPLAIDPASFKPSPSANIQTGMKVLHLKFGEGKVVSIDGGENNRVATIFFQGIDNPQRRIMLKFAKLQIL